MNNINDCVEAYQQLLNVAYRFVIGKKGKSLSFVLKFDKASCYHLMGLQHLKDIDALGGNREKVYDRILNKKIDRQMVEASTYYKDINDRVHYLTYLESMLDSNETVFKYHKRFNKYSRIDAEFLLSNEMFNTELYLFIDRDEGENYFCRSFFPKTGRDYTENQPRYTLLYKEKINLATGNTMVLYDRAKSEM